MVRFKKPNEIDKIAPQWLVPVLAAIATICLGVGGIIEHLKIKKAIQLYKKSKKGGDYHAKR